MANGPSLNTTAKPTTLKVGGSTPSPCHRVVSLDKKLCSTLSLSTQVYKMGTIDILLGVTLRQTSIPSGVGRGGVVAILSVASCYRNRDKFQPCGPPWLVCDFTCLTMNFDQEYQLAPVYKPIIKPHNQTSLHIEQLV